MKRIIAALALAAALAMSLLLIALKDTRAELDTVRYELAQAQDMADSCHEAATTYAGALLLSLDNTKTVTTQFGALLDGGVLAVSRSELERTADQQRVVNTLIGTARGAGCEALDKPEGP